MTVLAYEDSAVATLDTAADGSGRFTQATLRPRVSIARGCDPALALGLHEAAHRMCFLAASMAFPIAVEPHVTVVEPL